MKILSGIQSVGRKISMTDESVTNEREILELIPKVVQKFYKSLVLVY